MSSVFCYIYSNLKNLLLMFKNLKTLEVLCGPEVELNPHIRRLKGYGHIAGLKVQFRYFNEIIFFMWLFRL